VRLIATLGYLGLLLLSLDLAPRVFSSGTGVGGARVLAAFVGGLYVVGLRGVRQLRVPGQERIEHHRAALVVAAVVVAAVLMVAVPSSLLPLTPERCPAAVGLVGVSAALVGLPVYLGARWLSYSGWRERRERDNPQAPIMHR
jgi:hypothetical protein